MKKTKFLIIIILVSFIWGCSNKPTKELIIGTWEIKDGKIEDATRFYFGLGKDFKIFKGNKQMESEDKLEYRIVNEKDLSEYPNFKKEEDNGKIISIVLFEKSGKLYDGSNMIGPFEINSMSKDELKLTDIKGNFFNTKTAIFKRIE